jgi:copper chaperone CopZ
MYQVTLYVLGICCPEKVNTIENGIRKLGGILTFKSSLLKGRIVVDFKPNYTSANQIIDRIEEQGLAVVKKVQRESCHDIYN